MCHDKSKQKQPVFFNTTQPREELVPQVIGAMFIFDEHLSDADIFEVDQINTPVDRSPAFFE